MIVRLAKPSQRLHAISSAIENEHSGDAEWLGCLHGLIEIAADPVHHPQGILAKIGMTIKGLKIDGMSLAVMNEHLL